MGNKEVKLKLEVGDYKFECRGSAESMVDLAINHLSSYKKSLKNGFDF